MSTVTTNFGLTKPASIEQFNLATYNNNLDLIDGAILSEAHKIQYVEYVRQGQVAGTGLVGPGDLSTFIDSANSKNYTTWVTASTDTTTISQEGVYMINWKMVPNATVAFWHAMDTGGNPAAATLGRSTSQTISNGDSYWAYAGPFYVPPAGLTVTFKFSLASGQTVNHRIKLAKLK